MRKWFSKLEVIGVWNFIMLFRIGSIGFRISKFWLCLVAEKVWEKKKKEEIVLYELLLFHYFYYLCFDEAMNSIQLSLIL